jgi:hyperpolarization activated cyclic nucleotide-gated potassium channel 2
MAHWTACIFFYVGYEESMIEPDTWLMSSGVIDMDLEDKYVTSMYWAITTMATVGYGDYSPKTTAEQFVAILAQIIACGIFGYAVGSLGSSINKHSRKTTANREVINSLNRYMK